MSFNINTRAAGWVAEMAAGDMTQERWLELTTWLKESPLHKAAFLRMARASNALDLLSTVETACEPAQAWWRRPLFVVGATVTVLAAAALSFVRLSWDGWQTYETQQGASQVLTLADSSVVTLNIDSRVRVRLLGTRREVEVLRGEALFDVATDTQRQFEVRAGDEVVRVLGTRFSVRLGSDREVETKVVQGRVKVSASGAHSELGAGQVARESYGALTVESPGTRAVERQLSWTTGYLSFEGETLAGAVEQFNRYNRVKLVVSDPRLAVMRIGGVFSTTDVRSFCGRLHRLFRVESRSLSDDVVYLELPSGPPRDHGAP